MKTSTSIYTEIYYGIMKTQKCIRLEPFVACRNEWDLLIGPVWPQLGTEGPLGPLCAKSALFRFDHDAVMKKLELDRHVTIAHTNILTCRKMWAPFDFVK